MTEASRNPRPAISCVVPAFNEAANLELLLSGLTAQLAALSERWEIIVIDDGSRDTTPAAMAPWLTRPGVRYVRLSRNFGKEAALTAGIDRAAGDVVLLMDADLQHPASLVPQMLAAWVDGADMVCAARATRAPTKAWPSASAPRCSMHSSTAMRRCRSRSTPATSG
jgi:polyisoprenyl-phosphate glycosyltransferase